MVTSRTLTQNISFLYLKLFKKRFVNKKNAQMQDRMKGLFFCTTSTLALKTLILQLSTKYLPV